MVYYLSSLKDIGLREQAKNILTAEEVNHLFHLHVVKLSITINVIQDVKYKVISTWTQQISVEAIIKGFDEAERNLTSNKKEKSCLLVNKLFSGEFRRIFKCVWQAR